MRENESISCLSPEQGVSFPKEHTLFIPVPSENCGHQSNGAEPAENEDFQTVVREFPSVANNDRGILHVHLK